MEVPVADSHTEERNSTGDAVPITMDDLSDVMDEVPVATEAPTFSNPDNGLRRSTRDRKPPVWMQDYIGNVSHSLLDIQEGTEPSTYPYKVSPVFTSAYLVYLCNITAVIEPQTYKEACQYPEWLEAMDKELAALETNHTWELTELPPGKKPIGCKWVYKAKFKADGHLDKCKARLVGKGFNQQFGLDYTEVFSLVARHVTVRLLITIATVHSWPLDQIDVNNAFLHGFLKDDIYMLPPPGFKGATAGQVCKLARSLYGLKQASREWNMEFCRHLLNQGFAQSLVILVYSLKDVGKVSYVYLYTWMMC